AHRVVAGKDRPLVTIDWTDVGDQLCVLAAAIPCSGRAVLIYAEAHPLARYTNRRVEAAFLRKLRTVLPAQCRPIIVTDAGFRGPWLRRVSSMGWDYVGRVRGR